ncbi:MAG: hypothetical protein RRB13_07320 [bacterium]|nr:hypothetical protein [bacterium]
MKLRGRSRWVLLLWGLLASCSQPQAQLHPRLDPQSFDPPPAARELFFEQGRVRLVDLTTQQEDLKLLKQLWYDGIGQRLDEQQPVSRLSRDEIWVLDLLLSEHLSAFYLWPEGKVPIEQLTEELCEPISRRQLDFMSQTQSEEFRNLPSQLLLISLAELTLRQGASPKYPQIYSQTLRKEAGLPPRISLSDLWIPGNLKELKTQGFWICRR